MNLFLLFLLACFVGGLLMRERSNRERALATGVIVVLMTALYYFKNGLI